jgi:(E)-4-hydroxy-3-methylbut-2-enyl-diphosphate synthase
MKYCESINQTKRRPTREVLVGNIGVGAGNKVRIQSMTTTPTRDHEATIDQIINLADLGCEIVRVTVQGMKEADACENIKNGLLKKGYTIPLVADIHFFPPAAMRAIDFVDKVRINPGNYVDKRASFKVLEYTDITYQDELKRLEEKFSPLVEKAKVLKKAIRIGTNHGSLSDRVMNRYGDTPKGMVESALEFTRVCQSLDFHDLIFSMKASNPQVMIQAYRMLAAEMYHLNMNYPLHLGVTEAGMGEDGRIKSAMGIGALLLDGIGDTIRVSLTEDPMAEIDPCKRLVRLAENYQTLGVSFFEETNRGIDILKKREVTFSKNVAMHRDGTVIVAVHPSDLLQPDFYQKIGMDTECNRPKIKVDAADNVFLKTNSTEKQTQQSQETLKILQDVGVGLLSDVKNSGCIQVLSLKAAENIFHDISRKERFTLALANAPKEPLVLRIHDETESEWEILEKLQPAMIFLKPKNYRLHYCRKFFEWLQIKKLKIPVILNFDYDCKEEDLTIQAAAEYGSLFCDGLGNGIFIEGPYEINFLRVLSFNILQAARMRSSKTDFISCPSCGRTLFDLQDVTKRIQARTAHLPGVKIAIMGCIVNGPGEMADADFGYVGSKPGKIDLYVGKTCVEKDIDFAAADDRLIELIKSHGRWVEV